MKPATRQDYEKRMLRVLVHIQQNLDASPGLDELAAVAHFSPFHFHRVFRGMTGESLQAYVRRLRLERAAARLHRTDDSIIQIALEAGFDSHAAFSRAFKAQLGSTPSEWRTAGMGNLPNSGPQLAENQEGRSMEVKIVKENEVRVAFVRHTGPYEKVGSAWSTLCMRLGPEGRLGGAPRMIGLSYDDPEVTPPEAIRYDACVEVDADFEPRGEVGVQILPGGTFAMTTHHGPYTDLNRTYAMLMGQWLPGSGRRCRVDPTREVYLNDPDSTAPEDLVTDIYLPLEDAE